jgi:hypothetical protein
MLSHTRMHNCCIDTEYLSGDEQHISICPPKLWLGLLRKYKVVIHLSDVGPRIEDRTLKRYTHLQQRILLIGSRAIRIWSASLISWLREHAYHFVYRVLHVVHVSGFLLFNMIGINRKSHSIRSSQPALSLMATWYPSLRIGIFPR